MFIRTWARLVVIGVYALGFTLTLQTQIAEARTGQRKRNTQGDNRIISRTVPFAASNERVRLLRSTLSDPKLDIGERSVGNISVREGCFTVRGPARAVEAALSRAQTDPKLRGIDAGRGEVSRIIRQGTRADTERRREELRAKRTSAPETMKHPWARRFGLTDADVQRNRDLQRESAKIFGRDVRAEYLGEIF
jgi:hypothetical protein